MAADDRPAPDSRAGVWRGAPLEMVSPSNATWGTGTMLEISGTTGMNAGLPGRFVKM
jgi:hypothetical protein